MLNWIVWNRTVYVYKMDLALNNLQTFICPKTQTYKHTENQTIFPQTHTNTHTHTQTNTHTHTHTHKLTNTNTRTHTHTHTHTNITTKRGR